VIAYRDLTGGHGYHAAVRSAVRAWNRLHLGVRLVPAGAGAASNVQIAFAAGRCLSAQAGSATTGFQRFGGRIIVRACPRVVRPLLVAHELGRVLGLPDDDAGCSLMNRRGASDGRSYAAPAGCRGSRPAWLPQLVDPRTAARARALYAAPAAPRDARLVPGEALRIEWTEPRGSGAARTVVARSNAGCPTPIDVAARTTTVLYERPAYAGLHFALDAAAPVTGPLCYRVFNVGRRGRMTAAAGLRYRVGVPPAAAFTVSPTPGAGTPISFTDTSTDPDGSIVEWRWDFGDPGSGAADLLDTTDPAAGRSPTHTYAQPGAYVVRLTVVDDGGMTATATATVTVS
jgi:hypothetical protein